MIEISRDEIFYLIYVWHYLLTGDRGAKKNKVLINGSPKTGTTWMLMLTNSIPGYRRVGNFNGIIEKYKGLLPGDLAHGHDWYTDDLSLILKENNIKTILMIRDPRDQLISRVFHIRRDETHKWHKRLKDFPLDEAILLCIEGRDGLPGTRTMIELTQSWFTNGSGILSVRYEDLLSDPNAEFRHVLGYLRTNLPDRLVTSIIERNSFERLSEGRKFWRQARKRGQVNQSSHFRKGIVGDWKNYLNGSLKERFKNVAGDKLVELGYEHNLDW